jgi:hypothetical protein
MEGQEPTLEQMWFAPLGYVLELLTNKAYQGQTLYLNGNICNFNRNLQVSLECSFLVRPSSLVSSLVRFEPTQVKHPKGSGFTREH